jgi:uncharacterized protein YndB with AHSA1/START domain
MVQGQIEREVVIQAPPERVWAVLTEPAQVEMTLIPEGAGTRLRVVERGFGDLDLPESDRAQHLKENTEGWDGGLAAIKRLAESGPARA